MATVNRYTNYEPSVYQPRTLQELMMAPAYMRSQHDAADERIATAQTALAKIDYMDKHNPAVQKEQERLYNTLQKQTDALSAEGFNSSTKGDFIKFNSDYQTSVGPKGILGSAAKAKEVLEANKATYIANATKMGYDPQNMSKNWEDFEAEYWNKFNTTGKIENIGERFSPNYHNVTQELTDLFKSAGASDSDIANMGSRLITDDPNAPGHYILSTSAKNAYGSNIKQLQAAVDYINNQISNPNSSVGRSLVEQRMTPEQALQETAGLAGVFLKTSMKKERGSQMSGYKSAGELGLTMMEGNPTYETTAAESINIQQGNSNKILTNILTDAKKPSMRQSYVDSALTPEQIKKYNEERGDPYTLNDLSEVDLENYKHTFDKLQKSTFGLKNTNFDSPEAIKAVSDYYNGNQNIMRENIIITDDVMTTYGDNTIGTNKSDSVSVMKGIRASLSERKFSIGDSGETLTYDQLPDKIKQGFAEGSKKITYQGYYSPKNFMTKQFGNEQDKKFWVSPMSVKFFDDNGDQIPIMVSRATSELNQQSHKADEYFNNIFTETNFEPGLPAKLPGQRADITYFPEGVRMPGSTSEDKYLINSYDTQGFYQSPVFLTEQELQNQIYSGFGVIDPKARTAHNKRVEAKQKRQNRNN